MSHQLQITDFIKLKATAVKAPLPVINAAAAHLDCYILIISSHNLQNIKCYQLNTLYQNSSYLSEYRTPDRKLVVLGDERATPKEIPHVLISGREELKCDRHHNQ